MKPQILQAALIAFASFGFEGASVRQIAQDARISPAAVLHHFGNKRRLYGEVLRHISQSLEQHPVLSAPSDPGAAHMRCVVNALVDWIVDNGLFARIILREVMENDQRVRDARQLPLRDGMQVIYQAVRSALGADADDPISELLSLQLLGASFLFFTGQPTHLSQSSVNVDGWEEGFRSLLIETATAVVRQRENKL